MRKPDGREVCASFGFGYWPMSAENSLFRGPPAYTANTPWLPVRALLAAIAIVAVGILCAALLVGNLDAGMPRPGRWRPASQDAAALLTLGVWQTATVLLTILASSLFGGKMGDVLALRTPAGGSAVYLEALLLMLLLQVGVSIVQYGFLADDMLGDLRPFARLLAGQEWVLTLLVVGIGAPLSEELLFRGFLQSALAASRLGFGGAAVITTGLWTAMHAGYSTAGMVEVFLIGLLFSWLLWRTGSLRVALVCHALYNSLIVLVLRHVPLPT